MGEAKRRGNFDDRVAEAIAKRAAHEKREAEWNAKQAERRRERMEEDAKAAAIRPRESPKHRRSNRLVVTAMLALAASSMAGMK